MRVRLLRAHHNSVAVAYYNFVCCYRMKDSLGWQLIYSSPRMDHSIGHVAIVSKFGQVRYLKAWNVLVKALISPARAKRP